MTTEYETIIRFWTDLEREAKSVDAKDAAAECRAKLKIARACIEAHTRAIERWTEAAAQRKQARAATLRALKAHAAGSRDPDVARRLREALDIAQSASRACDEEFRRASIAKANAEGALALAGRCPELAEEERECLNGAQGCSLGYEPSIARRYTLENQPPRHTIRRWWPLAESRALAAYEKCWNKQSRTFDLSNDSRPPEVLRAAFERRRALAEAWWAQRRQELAAEAAMIAAEAGR